MQQTFFFFGILCHFLPFYPHNSPKNENIKKNPGHIIILHRCTKSHDHRLYCSWDMLHDRYNCHFSFYAIFCPLASPLTPHPPPLLTVKISKSKFKKKKKRKKHSEISSFYECAPKIMIRWYMVPEIWCATDGWTDGWTEKVAYRGGWLT